MKKRFGFLFKIVLVFGLSLEIDNFGKIAIGLSNHNYDDEDYSKW
jgi:hypothetical protein